MKTKNIFFQKQIKRNKHSFAFAALFAAITVSAISLVVLGSFLIISSGGGKTAESKIEALQSYYIAESGTEDGILRIRRRMQYQAVYSFSVGDGMATVNISESGGIKTALGQGDFGSAQKKVKADIIVNAAEVEFFYGAQVGDGGLKMENNASVVGSIYSNGLVEGSVGSIVSGDVYAAAVASTTPAVIFDSYNSDFSFGLKNGGNYQIDAAQSFRVSNEDNLNKIALYLKKIGYPNDASVKITKDKNGKPDIQPNGLMAQGTLYSSLVTSSYGWIDIVFSSNPELDNNQTYWIVIDTIRDDQNYWSWGYDFGSGYGSGQAKYSSDWTDGSWTNISGDMNFKIWLGGLPNSISNLTIRGDAYANTIINSVVSGNAGGVILQNSTVSGNANFDNMSNCSVGGDAIYNTQTGCNFSGGQTSPNTSVLADPPPLNMPISQAKIEEWKSEALAGGVYSGACPYQPQDGAVIGPIKIPCDLDISNGKNITIGGNIWVEGNIVFSNNVVVSLAPDFGGLSAVIVADDPDNHSVNGKIDINNNAVFCGSEGYNQETGSCNSQASNYLMVLSTYSGTESKAIKISNNTQGAIFYSSAGSIDINNNVTIKEVVGYKLELENNASIVYEQGLQNLQFSAGAPASYQIKNWKEVE